MGTTLYVMNLCRYSDQKSLPIPLDKGKYYYMETIMKDDHQNDHLEVGMQAPNGTNYTVIPSTFLRTSLPVPPSKSWRLCIVCYCLLCTVPQVTVKDFDWWSFSFERVRWEKTVKLTGTCNIVVYSRYEPRMNRKSNRLFERISFRTEKCILSKRIVNGLV